MEREQETRDEDRAESKPLETDRRQFLHKSLGAAPIVLTVINGRGWGGTSVHGTIWSSGGTDWKHRGRRWWKGRDWDKPAPLTFRTYDGSSERGNTETPARSDWDWQAPREDWRKWRPDGDETQRPDWQWGLDGSQDATPRDVSAAPIEETIRPKE